MASRVAVATTNEEPDRTWTTHFLCAVAQPLFRTVNLYVASSAGVPDVFIVALVADEPDDVFSSTALADDATAIWPGAAVHHATLLQLRPPPAAAAVVRDGELAKTVGQMTISSSHGGFRPVARHKFPPRESLAHPVQQLAPALSALVSGVLDAHATERRAAEAVLRALPALYAAGMDAVPHVALRDVIVASPPPAAAKSPRPSTLRTLHVGVSVVDLPMRVPVLPAPKAAADPSGRSIAASASPQRHTSSPRRAGIDAAVANNQPAELPTGITTTRTEEPEWRSAPHLGTATLSATPVSQGGGAYRSAGHCAAARHGPPPALSSSNPAHEVALLRHQQRQDRLATPIGVPQSHPHAQQSRGIKSPTANRTDDAARGTKVRRAGPGHIGRTASSSSSRPRVAVAATSPGLSGRSALLSSHRTGIKGRSAAESAAKASTRHTPTPRTGAVAVSPRQGRRDGPPSKATSAHRVPSANASRLQDGKICLPSSTSPTPLLESEVGIQQGYVRAASGWTGNTDRVEPLQQHHPASRILAAALPGPRSTGRPPTSADSWSGQHHPSASPTPRRTLWDAGYL